MKFFKYWSSGTADVPRNVGSWTVRRYAGSNTSVEDAAEIARGMARQSADAIASGQVPAGGYGYADRPLREEIVDEIAGAGNEPDAIVTRNSYGSLILNTASVMFADVDYPPRVAAPSVGRLLGRLFGRTHDPEPDRDQQMLQRFHDVAETMPGLGLRVYRTANGYRCLVTDRTFDPEKADSERLLDELGSDPLYKRLCQAQSCFRARLTAKCWRCGVSMPPCRFPFERDADQERYRAWEEQYHGRADKFAACALVTTFGSSDVHDGVAPVLDLHDRLACLDEGAKLA